MKKILLRSAMLICALVCANLSMYAGWEEVKSWDFKAMGAAVADKTTPSIDGAVTVGGTECDIATGDFEGLAFQGATKWMLRTTNGLYQGNGGDRMVAVLNLKADDKVTIAANAINVFNSLANATEDSSDAEANTITYKVTADGDFGVKMVRYNYIYSITVQRYEEAAGEVMVDYTINYLYGDIQLKQDTGTELAGQVIKATEPLTVDGQKYYFAEGATTSITLSADQANVLDVDMRKANVYNYTIKNNVNDVVVTGTCVEGEVASVPYSRYILKEGVVYLKDAINKEYNYTFTPNADNYEATIEYKAQEGLTGVFFSEAEDLEGMTKTTAQNANVRCSNAAGGWAEEEVTAYTLAAGKYMIEIGVWGNAGNTLVVKAGENEIISAATAGYWFTSKNEEELTLTAATPIVLSGANANKPFDYILITGTVDAGSAVEAVEVAEGEGKWYNLQGVQVAEPTQAGIYIHNGKKVIVK